MMGALQSSSRWTRITLAVLVLMLGILGGASQCSSGEGPPPPGQCRSEADCPNGESCLAPGEFPGCGMCYELEDQCANSADCGTGNVCVYDTNPCQCNGQARICQPSCATTGCPDGEACGSDGICAVIHCATGEVTCPELTTCTKSGVGNGCVRWACTLDADCGSGNACVNGQCYTSYGTCQPPVP